MSFGRCPRCARLYTPGEVTGTGVLRPRPEHRGGPLMEFTCPGCGILLKLIPHGWGRYAVPGEPPPPADPAAPHAPPWAATDPGNENRASREPEPEAYEIPAPPAAKPPQPWPEPEIREEVRSEAEAFDVLGIEPTPRREDIERAFRERSRTCHPDKVAHLDEEFLKLAERKFRRLKSAYDLLRTNSE